DDVDPGAVRNTGEGRSIGGAARREGGKPVRHGFLGPFERGARERNGGVRRASRVTENERPARAVRSAEEREVRAHAGDVEGLVDSDEGPQTSGGDEVVGECEDELLCRKRSGAEP